MKKLSIIIVAIMTSVMAQAATVNWGTGVMFAPGSDGTKSTTVKALGAILSIYTIDKAIYDSYAAMTYADASAAIYKAYNGSSADVSAKIESTMGTVNAGQTVVDKSGYNYAAAIITYKDGNGKDWYIANVGAANVTGTANVPVGNLGTRFLNDSTKTIGTWTAAGVPEPTSGVLLLIGMAGLALRRRHA